MCSCPRYFKGWKYRSLFLMTNILFMLTNLLSIIVFKVHRPITAITLV